MIKAGDKSLSSRRTWIEILVLQPDVNRSRRRSPHGERGLKYNRRVASRQRNGRSPHGERGLKYAEVAAIVVDYESLSSRRTWIEIASSCVRQHGIMSRSPHGERGLKSNVTTGHTAQASRSPHGERGLKWQITGVIGQTGLSLSSRRTWIEMPGRPATARCAVSLSSRRTWIEILAYPESIMRDAASLSSRRTWIEIEVERVLPLGFRSLSSRRTWIEISTISY